MGVSRLLLWVVIPVALLLALANEGEALMPYAPRTVWDIMPFSDDPFRILEQTPLSVPKATVDTLALARADWKETASAHVISMDVPGVRREDLKIEVEENRVVRISGEIRPEAEAQGDRWHRAERTAGRFWRQFRLPANADVEGIRAHLENGVVRITVPKVEEKKKEAKVVNIEEGPNSRREDINPTKAQI